MRTGMWPPDATQRSPHDRCACRSLACRMWYHVNVIEPAPSKPPRQNLKKGIGGFACSQQTSTAKPPITFLSFSQKTRRKETGTPQRAHNFASQPEFVASIARDV